MKFAPIQENGGALQDLQTIESNDLKITGKKHPLSSLSAKEKSRETIPDMRRGTGGETLGHKKPKRGVFISQGKFQASATMSEEPKKSQKSTKRKGGKDIVGENHIDALRETGER